jgi:hypothetical protein
MGIDITGFGAIGDAISSVANTIGKFIPDKDLAEKGKQAVQAEAFALAQKAADVGAQAAQDQFELEKAQIAVDAIEAASPSFFKSGWRPWLGWASGTLFILLSVIMIVGSEFYGLSLTVQALTVYGYLGALCFGLCGLRFADKFIGQDSAVPKAIAIKKK